jgi:uncharacterized membrane protein
MSSAFLSDNVLGAPDGTGWCWHLKRNISLTPVQMASIFAGLSFITLVIGVAFYQFGASFVLPFSMIEITALSIAFVYNAIHANDYEKLVIKANEIYIESKIGFQVTHVEMVRSLTRVNSTQLCHELIEIKQGHFSSDFGRFIHINARLMLAKQISARLLTLPH